MSEYFEYLSPLLNATAFAEFKEGIVTEIEELELVDLNSIQKIVSMKFLREQRLQVALTVETLENADEPRCFVSMQFIEDDIYVDVVDDVLFLTFFHLVEEVYQFIEPIIEEMNYILNNKNSNVRIDTSYLQSKIERFKNLSDEKKEQIYSMYNILFI